jgi:hypothetical protein
MSLTPREFWALRRRHEDEIEVLDSFQAHICHTIHTYAPLIKNKPRKKAADFMLTKRPAPPPRPRKRTAPNDTTGTAG